MVGSFLSKLVYLFPTNISIYHIDSLKAMINWYASRGALACVCVFPGLISQDHKSVWFSWSKSRHEEDGHYLVRVCKTGNMYRWKTVFQFYLLRYYFRFAGALSRPSCDNPL